MVYGPYQTRTYNLSAISKSNVKRISYTKILLILTIFSSLLILSIINQVYAILPDSGKQDNNTVDFQALEASQAKCTILYISGKEACNVQAFLTLGVFTSVIIGTIIAISMITLKRSMRKNHKGYKK